MKNWSKILLVLCVSMFLFACTTKIVHKPVPPMMPEWCLKSSGTEAHIDRGLLVIGVGNVSGIKSPTMARTNADGKSRTALAKMFKDFSDKILNEYSEFARANNVGDPDADIEKSTRLIALINSRSGAIEDRYVDEKTNTWYSKAVLTEAEFVKMLTSNEELPLTFIEFIPKRAKALVETLPKHTKTNQ